MEGKACLFKKFADIDVFDLEIAETDVDKFFDIVAALEPTFGGINLEDIKAPACFEIEEELRKRMRIPVFHDDQHGTAIISGAGAAQRRRARGEEARRPQARGVGRRRGGDRVRRVLRRARRGAREHHPGRLGGRHLRGARRDVNVQKARFARKDDGRRTLADAMRGADMFMGVSVANGARPRC